MTALTQYDRLEAPGLFTPGEGAQRVDVVLSVGNASLTITDHRDVALAHWSLAAVERLNPGKRPAIFAPGPDAPERLETSDHDMITAIEKVRTAVDRGRPHPGRLRNRLLIAGIAAGLAIAVFWLPDAITRTTVSMVPPPPGRTSARRFSPRSKPSRAPPAAIRAGPRPLAACSRPCARKAPSRR